MACNYLVKFEKEDEFDYVCIKTCGASSPNQVALRYFTFKYAALGVKVGNLDALMEQGAIMDNIVVVKYSIGVSVVECRFEVKTASIKVPENFEEYKKGTNTRTITTKQLIAAPLDEKYTLLPEFASDNIKNRMAPLEIGAKDLN